MTLNLTIDMDGAEFSSDPAKEAAQLLLEAAVELRDPARSRAIEQAWGNPSVKGGTNIVSMKLMADYGTDNVCEVKVNAD